MLQNMWIFIVTDLISRVSNSFGANFTLLVKVEVESMIENFITNIQLI